MDIPAVRQAPSVSALIGVSADGVGVDIEGTALALGEGVAVPVDFAWSVHPADEATIISRAATTKLVLTSRVSALRESFGPSGHIDGGNVSPVGDLIPEIAGAVAGVLAGVADGLAHDANSGAV